MDKEQFWTVNYLFASYLQTKEAGGHKISRIEKLKPGKARFYFSVTKEQAEVLQVQYHNSVCSEFESIRKATIDLCY